MMMGMLLKEGVRLGGALGSERTSRAVLEQWHCIYV